MSKKGKKFDAPEGAEQQTIGANDVGTMPAAALAGAEGTEPAKVSPIGAPRAPTLYLQDDATGLHYKFDRRNHLPKKATVVGNLVLDGNEVPFQVTSNKGWVASADKTIDYLWFAIPGVPTEEAPEPEGIKGFITLDYTVEGKSFVGVHFSLKEGTPDRFPMKADGTGYAERIGKTETEDKRKEAFVATMAKKKAEKAAATTEPATTEPTAETQPAE
jgi:hypothetical protein